ncbi:MAG: monovalent cation/H(+) antiporter subunit G [Endomicrobiales bacterium]
MIDYIAYTCVTLGVILNVLAALSVFRFPDVYLRLLGSTKFVTLGILFIMLGVLLANGFSATGVKAVLCAVFILLTSPVEAHALARSARKAEVPPMPGTAGEITKISAEKRTS